MPDKVIDIPGVGPTAFPDSMTEAQINAAATRVYQDSNPGKKQPPQSNWSAVAMSGAAEGAPLATRAAEEIATNPAVPRGAASIGRAVGAVEGALKGGPLAIGPGAWAGGKGGWFSGKVVQSAAGPVAKALEAAAPYAQTLSTASGAQGALDLAQMAEPNRQDIGFLGMAGKGSASDQASVIGAQIKALVTQGMAPGEAARTVYNAWAKQLREQTK